MLRYARRNHLQLKDCINGLKSSGFENLTPKEKKLLKEMEDKFNKTANILDQQERLAKGRKVKDRIVSFHNQNVRPMVRGKYPVNVEFGKKNLFIEKDGFLELAGSYYDNVSDTKLMETALEFHEEVYGESAEGVGADRRFHSPANRKACEKRSMKRIGIQRKGKPKKSKKKESWEERMRRRRCGIEGHISVGKRRYGLDRAEYRIPDGEEIWVRMGLVVMNLKRAVKAA